MNTPYYNVKASYNARLDIIMPVCFLFFNSHILLLLFLRFSAIILKLCSKNLNSQTLTINESNL